MSESKTVAIRNISTRKFILTGDVELTQGKVVKLPEDEAKRLVELYPGELEDVAGSVKAAEAAGGSTEPKAPADMTAKEIKAALDELKVEYAPNASKAELVAALEEAQKAAEAAGQ